MLIVIVLIENNIEWNEKVGTSAGGISRKIFKFSTKHTMRKQRKEIRVNWSHAAQSKATNKYRYY